MVLLCRFLRNALLTQIIETFCVFNLLSHWDPILKEHVLKVDKLQKKGERLQVHFLSNEFQNKFIVECSDLAKQHVFWRREVC